MEDNYYETDRVSGGDINIQEAPGRGTQFLNSFLKGLTSSITQSSEKKKKDEIEKANFYATLRKSGYSKEEAINHVDKVFSGGFLEKVLGKSQSFIAPSSDTYDLETEKTKAEIEKSRADVGLTQAKADYYRAGGPKRTVIDTMTPNQLQQRLKFLSESLDPDDPDTQEEIQMITEKLRGMTMKQADQPATAEQKTTPKISEGTIAKNPQTKKRIIFKGGKWQNLI